MTNEEIDKLEAGPELDARIADYVMGGYESKTIGFITFPGGKNQVEAHADFDKALHYSTKIEDAWRVVEKAFKRGWMIEPFNVEYEAAVVYVWANGTHQFIAQGDTVQVAICRATLKAVGA